MARFSAISRPKRPQLYRPIPGCPVAIPVATFRVAPEQAEVDARPIMESLTCPIAPAAAWHPAKREQPPRLGSRSVRLGRRAAPQLACTRKCRNAEIAVIGEQRIGDRSAGRRAAALPLTADNTTTVSGTSHLATGSSVWSFRVWAMAGRLDHHRPS